MNHADVRNIWPGMKYNREEDDLKNYRQDFDKFLNSKIRELDFFKSGKMACIHYYPMILIFENFHI